MPIIVTEPTPDTLFGGGHVVSLRTDTIGSFIPPVEWNIQILDVDQLVTHVQFSHTVSDPHQLETFTMQALSGQGARLSNLFQQGSSVVARFQLSAGGQIAETVSLPYKLDTQGWIYNQVGASGTTDLTPVLEDTEAIQADTTILLNNWATYTSVTLPSLNDILALIQQSVTATLQFAPAPVSVSLGEIFSILSPDFWADRDLSGGTTCERVDYDASFNALFGVSVQVESYPADWRLGTPDHAWGIHDLAVLTFTRGGNTIERHGIHTVSHTVSPLPQFPWPWQSAIPIALQPGDTHIIVDWAEGVCGRLIGHVLP